MSKCHACHANETLMSPSAAPATQSAATPRATNGDQARHQGQPSATSATPATPNAGRCRQVPRLPRTWNVDVTMSKCHACHANETWMSPSATPATQVPVCDKVVWLRVCGRWCVTKLCVKHSLWQSCVRQSDVWQRWWERWCVCVTKFRVKDNVWQSCVCVWQSDMWQRWWQRWCVTKLCVRAKVVCDKVVCVWQSCVKDSVWQSCVWKIMCDKVMCDKDGVWQSCVWKRVWQSCVCVCEKMVCDKVWVERWCVTMLCGGSGGGGGGGGAGYRIKNKNPTQRCGEIERPGNCILILDVHHLAHKNWKGNAVNIFQTCPGAAFPSHVALPGNSSHAIFSPYPSSMAQLWNCVIILCIQPPRPPCGRCTGPRQGRP